MSTEFKKDKFGGEVKTDEGIDHYAIWIPITLAEKEVMFKKAEAEKVNVAALTANFLREWSTSKQLSDADLSKVAGGAMRAPRMSSTLMCPW